MKQYVMIVLILLMSLNQGCAMQAVSHINKEDRLKERVEKAYQYYKERQFEKFINLFDREFFAVTSKQERIAKFEEGLPILVAYKIKELKINGEQAKVKVENTVKFEDKKTKDILIVTDTIVDYWIFKDNEWYLYEFGKGK